jgi:hypothetical protein
MLYQAICLFTMLTCSAAYKPDIKIYISMVIVNGLNMFFITSLLSIAILLSTQLYRLLYFLRLLDQFSQLRVQAHFLLNNHMTKALFCINPQKFAAKIISKGQQPLVSQMIYVLIYHILPKRPCFDPSSMFKFLLAISNITLFLNRNIFKRHIHSITKS